MLTGRSNNRRVIRINRPFIYGLGVLAVGGIVTAIVIASENEKRAESTSAPIAGAKIASVPGELETPVPAAPPLEESSAMPSKPSDKKADRPTVGLLVPPPGPKPAIETMFSSERESVFASFDGGDRSAPNIKPAVDLTGGADLRQSLLDVTNRLAFPTPSAQPAAVPTAPLARAEDELQNRQAAKAAFAGPAKGIASGSFRSYNGAPMLAAGTVFHVVLITAANTDLPGTILGRVAEAVYDSATQQILMIPAGAVLVGKVNSDVTFGQDKAQVAWTTLVRRDGEINLGSIGGADANGAAGISGNVATHFWSTASWATLGLIVGAGGNLARGSAAATTDRQTVGNVAGDTVAQEAGLLAQKLTGRGTNRQPTITTDPLQPVAVILDQTFALPPVPAS